jgi:hypothetical protein
MELTDNTRGNSKVAFRIEKDGWKIKSEVRVTVSEHCPESIQLTHKLSRTTGWRQVTVFPIKKNGRKDYIKFLIETKEAEVWIKVSTNGGRSKIFVR